MGKRPASHRKLRRPRQAELYRAGWLLSAATPPRRLAILARNGLEMETVEKTNRFAWQPITPKGVATFARAPLSHLLTVQMLCALVFVAAELSFLDRAWFPVVTDAIRHLQPEGRIQSGVLDWGGIAASTLAENRFLSLAVDLPHEGTVRSPAHFQVEFGRTGLKIFSVFGFVEAAYPARWTFAFNRPELEPAWGAWRPAFLAMAGLVTLAVLMAGWAIVALIYLGPVWVIGFLADRDLDLSACRRLAGAALMPGALLLSLGLVLYTLGILDLLQLGVVWALHLLAGWVYVCIAPFMVERPASAGAKASNPFAPAPATRTDSTA